MKVHDIKFSTSDTQNREKEPIARHEVRSPNKSINHHFVWLVCETRGKILLSHPETSLTTPRLLPLRRSRRSYRNYQSSQSSGSSRNFFKLLGPWGQSGRSYGNQALLLLLLLLLLKNLRIYGVQYHMPHQYFSISWLATKCRKIIFLFERVENHPKVC